MKRIFFLASLLIVVVSSIPRGVELLSGNYLFGFDQGRDYLAVKQIVVDHKFRLIGAEVGGHGGFFQGPGWYYLLSIPFVITNGNPYGAAVLMFAIGIATVVVALWVGRKIFDVKTALIIGTLLGISPEIISQSRFIWPPFPASLLTVFFIFFLFKVLQKKEKFLPLFTFTIGLMSHFEAAVGGALLVQCLLFFPILFFKKIVTLRLVFFSVLSFLVTLTPLFIFDVRHDSIITKGALRLGEAPALNPSHKVTLLYIHAMFVNHFDVFRNNFVSTFQQGNQFWLVLLVILVLGSIACIRDRTYTWSQKALVFYLVLSPLTIFFVLMFYQWPMWQWWILELSIFYCFLLGIILGHFWKEKLGRILIAIFFIISLWSFTAQTIGFYRNDFNDFGGTHKIKGKLEALDYIYKDAKSKPFGLLVFTPPIYTYAYDYLIWWHGEKNYHYRPHGEKRGLFYLLIEPDPHKPWTYRGWLETVVKTGTVLETKELPSGFIIEKREALEDEI